MTWSTVKKTLTTPPPSRPPPLKYPLFTTDPFSTKSFGPGHIVGAGVLVVGLVGLMKFFIARGRDQAEETRRLAQRGVPVSPPPSPAPESTEPEPPLAKVENQRGQYGTKP